MSYQYDKPWPGERQTIEAASCEFTPTHVVFRDAYGLIIRAELAARVLTLTNTAAAGGTATLEEEER